ncbi:MAG: sodium:calcium antiporter [Candidatus Bipolaricaulota bacterium]|nr:MAG: sodium:calcium antiporter [Candidatus Bipolaricaulota bacterium]
MHWLTFALAAVAVILAGIKLASFGDALGRRSGIGQGWIGLLFLATITSIPELTTTITGASIGAPNIAVGNAFGSNLFNVAIIAVIDILLLRRGTLLTSIRHYHVTSAGIAILLTALAALGILLEAPPLVAGVSAVTWLIFLGYIGGVYLLFLVERREGATEPERKATPTLPVALIGFLVCAAIIIAAGIFLVRSSKAISEATGLSATFMGAILVAIVTSLPELATSIGGLRLRAYDMILGNLLGSNMFNILTVFFADLAFRRGSLLAGLGGGATDQLIVGFLGIAITSVAIIGIGARSRRTLLTVGVDAALILAIYLGGAALLIHRGIGL